MSVLNKVVFAAVGALTGSVANKALNGTWTRVTGEEPPDLADPDLPAHRTLAWVVLSAVAIVGTQLFLNRIGKLWEAKAKPIAVRIGK